MIILAYGSTRTTQVKSSCGCLLSCLVSYVRQSPLTSELCSILRLTGFHTTTDWLLFGAVQLACYLLAQQQTIALLLVVRSSFTAAIISIYMTIIYLMLGSGAVR
jgi:hypothetical protein